MDKIFKKAYKESNNFIDFWGNVIFYFHAERGLPIDFCTKIAYDWYVKHKKKIINFDIVKETFDKKMSNHVGEIPEWDGVSGVKELEEKIRELIKEEELKIFNKEKEEASSGK